MHSQQASLTGQHKRTMTRNECKTLNGTLKPRSMHLVIEYFLFLYLFVYKIQAITQATALAITQATSQAIT